MKNIKIIDTEENIGKHTPICSCSECIKIKRVVFGGMSKSFKEEIRLSNPLLYQVLINDEVW